MTWGSSYLFNYYYYYYYCYYCYYCYYYHYYNYYEYHLSYHFNERAVHQRPEG